MKLLTQTDSATTRATIKLYIEAIRDEKQTLILAVLFIALATTAYTVLIPLFMSFVIQSLISNPGNIEQTYVWIVAILIMSVLTIILNNKGFRWLFKNQEIVQTRLISRAVTHLLSRSHDFFSNHKVGSLTGDVTSFGRSYLAVTDAGVLQALGIAVNFVVSLIIIAFMSPALLVPLCLLTAGIIYMSIHSLNKRSSFRNERRRLSSLLTGSISDVLSNNLLVRVFARTRSEIGNLVKERGAIQDLTIKDLDILQTEANYRYAVLFTFQIATLLLGLWLFSQGAITIAALVFTITYLGRITGSLFNITGFIRQIEQGLLDATPMTKILTESIEINDLKKAGDLRIKSGRIECKSLTFSYNDNKQVAVFSDMNLVIAAGQRVGLAGQSGGGKTTFTQLILRFADLQSGKILIDGQDIAEVTQESLHANISYVPQDPFLFHRSLRENIAYGKPNASEEEIIDAARKAHAMEFIDKLPAGLDTIVGERGVKLSGGQRQRVAIARAILKDAPILILDEATSALDSESEKLIQASLVDLMRDRTSIVIAHRLSTIAKLDRIIVLGDGKIIEDGTHQQLLTNNGMYAKLWSHQSGGFIEE